MSKMFARVAESHLTMPGRVTTSVQNAMERRSKGETPLDLDKPWQFYVSTIKERTVAAFDRLVGGECEVRVDVSGFARTLSPPQFKHLIELLKEDEDWVILRDKMEVWRLGYDLLYFDLTKF